MGAEPFAICAQSERNGVDGQDAGDGLVDGEGGVQAGAAAEVEPLAGGPAQGEIDLGPQAFRWQDLLEEAVAVACRDDECGGDGLKQYAKVCSLTVESELQSSPLPPEFKSRSRAAANDGGGLSLLGHLLAADRAIYLATYAGGQRQATAPNREATGGAPNTDPESAIRPSSHRVEFAYWRRWRAPGHLPPATGASGWLQLPHGLRAEIGGEHEGERS